MPVEQSRTQLSGMTEDNLSLRPPTPKYRGSDDPVKVAVSDYPANIQRQRFALHLRTSPSHPSIVLSQTDFAHS